MKKAKQQIFHEELLTMEHVVKELHNDINEASKHSNIDSAKKRAVM